MTAAERVVAHTIQDVAALADVSVGTVSNVLNRPELVAQRTRQRVQDVIEQVDAVGRWSCWTAPARPARCARPRWTTCAAASWPWRTCWPAGTGLLPTPLTSVRQPRYQLGRAAADLLLAEAAAELEHRHRQLLFQPELAVRASSS